MKKVMKLFFHALFMDIQRIVKFSFIMGVLLIFSLLCAVGCRQEPTNDGTNTAVPQNITAKGYYISNEVAAYLNANASPQQKAILQSLNCMEVRSSDHGGSYADNLAPATFASVQLLKLQMDSILSMMNHREIDSFGVFKTYFNDHYDELMGKKKK